MAKRTHMTSGPPTQSRKSPADHAFLVPVSHEGEHLFTAVAKARDVCEEAALIFPAVCIQWGYRTITDIVCMASIFNALLGDVQRNAGPFRGVACNFLDGAVVGQPKFPQSCSVATTDIIDRLVNGVGAVFADIGERYEAASEAHDVYGMVLMGRVSGGMAMDIVRLAYAAS